MRVAATVALVARSDAEGEFQIAELTVKPG